MIPHAHAVVDKRAVVIRALHTPVAYQTVSGPQCLHCLAVGAELLAGNLIDQVLEVHPAILKVAGIHAAG